MPVPPRVVARLVAGGGRVMLPRDVPHGVGGGVWGILGVVFGVVMVVEVVRLLWLFSGRVM